MKRLFAILLALLLFPTLPACDREHTHSYSTIWSSDDTHHWKPCTAQDCDAVIAHAEHTMGEPVEDGKGGLVYTCTICNATRLTHIHSFTADWTSNGTHHWHGCSYPACTETQAYAAHAWGEPTEIKPASSGEEGRVQYQCTVCGATRQETTYQSEPKMSEADWLAAFAFENVQIHQVTTMGNVTAAGITYLVDGNAVEQLAEGEESTYTDRSILKSFDFSSHYEDFVHIGNDVYTATRLSLQMDGSYYAYENCRVTFAEGKITAITYQMDFSFFGTITDRLTFSNWGSIHVSPPTLTPEDLAAALQAARFEQNFTLYRDTYTQQDYTSVRITVVDDIYTTEELDLNGNAISASYASADGLAQELVSQITAITDLLDAELFTYDSYVGFVYTETVWNFNGQGENLAYIALEISDGYLTFFAYETEDGNGVSYTFSGYHSATS